MAEPFISLIPVRPADLEAGKPAPYAIYDWHGKLLLAAGNRIESRRQRVDLVENGFMHDPRWDQLARQPSRIPAPLMNPRRPSEAEPSEEQAASDGDKELVVAMDAVRWAIGETLSLQQADSPSIRHTVRLIGYAKGKTVLVSAPAADGKVVLMREGQSFVARAFAGRMAYAFATSAVKLMHSPHPYLHLSYPKEVRCTAVRRAARAEVKIVAAITISSAPAPVAATLTDLSLGGASALARCALGKKGDKVEIKFKLNAAGQDEYLSLRADLRSVWPDEQGNGFRHGFEFVEVPKHARLILAACVHQILAEGQA